MTVQPRNFPRIHRYIFASYLFVRWDVANMITIVCFVSMTFPSYLQYSLQMAFSVISSSANGLPSARRIALCALWVYLHALFLCIANQCSNAKEDAINKPFRPLPSGLISHQEAIGLLFALVPICISQQVGCFKDSSIKMKQQESHFCTSNYFDNYNSIKG
jgi:hypothetical protein